jgi:hypothetical protein
MVFDVTFIVISYQPFNVVHSSERSSSGLRTLTYVDSRISLMQRLLKLTQVNPPDVLFSVRIELTTLINSIEKKIWNISPISSRMFF